VKTIYSKDIVSLPRALSKLGFCSRTESIVLIRGNRVSVNGQRENDPRRRVSLVTDRLSVDGRILKQKKEFLYLCLHKPSGVVTSRSDERGAVTVYDLLGKQNSWVFPVGRLDKESSGLLLFTNDTRFGELLTNPDYNHTKTYHVRVDRPIRNEDLRKLSRGIVLEDGYVTMPARARREKKERNGSSFIITLREGKNRQIRRMCETLGYSVVVLHRSGIGRLFIQDLEPGKWRPLTEDERMLALAR
jgi:23S rRNA pseudouridine2605 synthase